MVTGRAAHITQTNQLPVQITLNPNQIFSTSYHLSLWFQNNGVCDLAESSAASCNVNSSAGQWIVVVRGASGAVKQKSGKMFGPQTNSNYFPSYSSLEPDSALHRMNGADGRTLSAPDIARNKLAAGSGNNTLNSAARRRMEDRMFTRWSCSAQCTFNLSIITVLYYMQRRDTQ